MKFLLLYINKLLYLFIFLIINTYDSNKIVCNSAFTDRVTDELISLYTFQDGQIDNSISYIKDHSSHINKFGDLKRDMFGTSWNNQQQGLLISQLSPGVPIETSQFIKKFYDHISINNQQELSFEFWIEHPLIANLGSTTPYLVAGFNNESSVTECTTNNNGFALKVASSWEYTVAPNCITQAFPSATDDPTTKVGLKHIVYILKPGISVGSCPSCVPNPVDGPSCMFIDYYNYCHSLTLNNYDSWDKTLNFQIGTNFTSGTYPGKILAVAIYQKALSGAEVLQNYQAGVPNSLPYLNDKIIMMGEDILSLFNITANDYDNDDLTFQILSLPTSGDLYANISGVWTKLINTNLPYNQKVSNNITNAAYFQYLSAKDQYGINITTFKYRVYDGIGYSRNATATISVYEINDAPIAQPCCVPECVNEPSCSLDAICSDSCIIQAYAVVRKVITLNGTDHVHDPTTGYISGAKISSLPSNGTLYQANCTTSSYLSCTTGDELTNLLTFPIDVVDSLNRIIYVSNVPLSINLEQAEQMKDLFSYVIVDNIGAISIPADLSISVLNSLLAYRIDSIGKEDETQLIQLKGEDKQELSFDFYITQYPHDGILQQADGTIIDKNVLPTKVTNTSGIIQYIPPTNKYSTKTSNGYIPFTNFLYHVRSSDGRISSENFTYVTLEPVNDLPSLVLQCENGKVITELDAVINPNPDRGQGSIFCARIDDVDSDQDIFLVLIETKDPLSAVSLYNENNNLRDVEFIKIGNKPSGDGGSDARLYFKGTRAHINAVLKEMHYMAARYEPMDDTITITITDDNNGIKYDNIQMIINVHRTSNPDNDVVAANQSSGLLIGFLIVVIVPFACCFIYWFRTIRYWNASKGVKEPCPVPSVCECCCYQLRPIHYERLDTDDDDNITYNQAYEQSMNRHKRFNDSMSAEMARL